MKRSRQEEKSTLTVTTLDRDSRHARCCGTLYTPVVMMSERAPRASMGAPSRGATHVIHRARRPDEEMHAACKQAAGASTTRVLVIMNHESFKTRYATSAWVQIYERRACCCQCGRIWETESFEPSYLPNMSWSTTYLSTRPVFYHTLAKTLSISNVYAMTDRRRVRMDNHKSNDRPSD